MILLSLHPEEDSRSTKSESVTCNVMDYLTFQAMIGVTANMAGAYAAWQGARSRKKLSACPVIVGLRKISYSISGIGRRPVRKLASLLPFSCFKLQPHKSRRCTQSTISKDYLIKREVTLRMLAIAFHLIRCNMPRNSAETKRRDQSWKVRRSSLLIPHLQSKCSMLALKLGRPPISHQKYQQPTPFQKHITFIFLLEIWN
jgi:hypothetical protein